jgi:hypothetical protein
VGGRDKGGDLEGWRERRGGGGEGNGGRREEGDK